MVPRLPVLPMMNARQRANDRSRLSYDRRQMWLVSDQGHRLSLIHAVEETEDHFLRWYNSQYGQDEHEHVSVFIDNLIQHANAISEQPNRNDKHQTTTPTVLVQIRRVPRRAPAGLPQEGGTCGWHCDLGVIFRANVPDFAAADRITLIQAKKIAPPHLAVGIDRHQMDRLIEKSPHAHYLFFVHRSFLPNRWQRPCTVFLPALTVADILRAQNSDTIPVDVVLAAGKDLRAFLLQDIVGLWTGDPNPDLITQARRGNEVGQGPLELVELELTFKGKSQ